MLLLVLILVLIAFGLLVVALLSGSVLWAWVSVGVSVAAAAVLLVDWLQRRSAVKAGAEAGDAAPAPPAAAVPPPHAVDREPAVEPATEIIPAVRTDAPYGASPSADTAAPADRHDERPDPQETVVMRAVAPSGSAEGPSGALGGIGGSGQDPSRSVTAAADDSTVVQRPSGSSAGRENDAREAPPGSDPDSETTVKVAGTSAPAEPPAAPAGGPPRSAEPPAGPPPGVPGGHGGAGAHGGVVPPERSRQEFPPLGPDGAPPEEPRDADAAGLVAELADEVLVVDELPRYHLAGCRSLSGRPVISLPAREAVELGFTPCAWCTPDRTLSTRHSAAAR